MVSDTADRQCRWISGGTRSGKTTRLIEVFRHWGDRSHQAGQRGRLASRGFLVFAASGDNRIDLADRIETETAGRIPFDSTTPLGFFQNELILFWPLVLQQLQSSASEGLGALTESPRRQPMSAQVPLRLRPETEQILATRLWRPQIDGGQLVIEGVREYYVVRRMLDLLQLAANGGVPVDDISALLRDGFGEARQELWTAMGEAIRTWKAWCLERGFLTYGLIADLYGQVLLPLDAYQQQLCRRYSGVLADDVDEYPAIAHDLFATLMDCGLPGCFTFNSNGAMRLGLGADPEALSRLAERCLVEELLPEESVGLIPSLSDGWGNIVWAAVADPLGGVELPPSMQSIQTVSRAELLRQTAEVIQQGVQSGQVEPQDIAVIGPGLDAIARYTLRQILDYQGIPVTVLHDQQPLASSPMIRALLALLAMVYPGLGRLIDREAVAELLVVLSQQPMFTPMTGDRPTFGIDPVRAGLITDYCFKPDPLQPELLPVTAYDRWDRLGYEATEHYRVIREWITAQQQQQQQRLIATPVVLLDRAIQHFLFGGSHLPYDQQAVLRELMETAQHFWEIEARLRQTRTTEPPIAEAVATFIQLLRDGTITADPYPVRPLDASPQAVTLATLFQYRAERQVHRWQFWLDAGSALWLTGGAPLFGAPLFLRHRPSRPWSAAEELDANQERLRRNVLDLMGRSRDRIYLCHSDLATSGQEQSGPLMTLVNAALPVDLGAIAVTPQV